MQLVRMLLLVVIVAPAGFGAEFEVTGENLLKNPGVEVAGESTLPADWSGPADIFSRSTDLAHEGEACLAYVNSDPEKYVMCVQSIELQPGRMYQVSAWVKTQDVEGADSGATICLEWNGPDGKYLGGHYPTGVKGTTEWQQLTSLTPRIPEGAQNIRFLCYLRKGMSGAAWWDDVSLAMVREDPLDMAVVEPNYRGYVTDAGPAQARVRTVLTLDDYDLGLGDVRFRWRITSGETVASEGVADAITESETDLMVDVQALAPGDYRLSVAVEAKADGHVLSEKSAALHRVTEMPAFPSYIDTHNRLIHNGEPFFPLGMYWGGVNEDDLAVYADSPFNCLMPYGKLDAAAMDAIHAHGLKVIYSVKDAYHGTQWSPEGIETEDDELAFLRDRAEGFKNHPALLAWYINDELPLSMLDRLTKHRDWMEDLDPGHPTWVVLYQVDQVRDYLPTFDVIGTDPYPIPNKPASMAAEHTRKTRDAVFDARPLWQVPQVFNWANYKKTEEEKNAQRPPTLDEIRSMVWQCIAEGADGIVMYSWFDLKKDQVRPFEQGWNEVKSVAQEVKDLVPALLSVEPTPAIAVEAPGWLHWAVRQLSDVTYLVAVNNGQGEGDVTFTLPAKPAGVAERGGEALSAESSLTVHLAPLQVRFFEITGVKP